MNQSFVGKALAATLFVTMLLPLASNAQTVKEVLEKHYKAVGQEKLAKFQNYTATGTMSLMGMDAPMTAYYKRPDKVRMEMQFMGMSIVTVYDGVKAYVSAPGQGIKEVGGDELKDMKKQGSMDDQLYVAEKKGAKITLLGKEKFNTNDVYKLLVLDGTDTTKAYVDASSYYLLKIETSKPVQGKITPVELVFSDFKTVDGVTMPYSMVTNSEGNKVLEMKYDKLDFTSSIDEKQFVKPQQ